MARRTREEMLQAYHDGELGFLARWRVERRLAASSEARETLQGLRLVGELVRESHATAPTPDLWAAIARELPVAPAAAEPQGFSEGLTDVLAWLFRPAGVAVATAAAAAVAFFVLSGSEPAGVANVVRYLDPGDNSVMLLQGEDDATIIWVMEPVATDTSGPRETRALI